jgi:hypothetical protein
VLATSLFGGAGSNLTAGSILYQSKQITCLSLKLESYFSCYGLEIFSLL